VLNSASLSGTDINGNTLLWTIDLRTGTVTASHTAKGATTDSAFSPSGVEVGGDGRYAIANIRNAVTVCGSADGRGASDRSASSPQQLHRQPRRQDVRLRVA
jgi:hypothetical protein